MTKIHSPIAPFATAFGVPISDAIDRVVATAHELSVAAEKTSPSQGFGSRIAQAIKRKQSPRHAAAVVFAASAQPKAENQSFGQKIKESVEKQSRHMKTQQQHKEQAEREKGRYHKPQPRQRTKGE